MCFSRLILICSSLFTRTLHHQSPQSPRAACNANDPCTVGLRHLCGDAAYSPCSSAHNDHVTFGWSTQDAAHPNEGGDTRGDAKEVQRGFLRNLRNLGVPKKMHLRVRVVPKNQHRMYIFVRTPSTTG